jgi:hypothetical protein
MLDGKIAEHFANRDDVGMMRQLGLRPPPPSLSGQYAGFLLAIGKLLAVECSTSSA